MEEGKKSTPILLKNVHYAPCMAFTLILVSRMDIAGFALHIESGTYTIRSPKPKSTIIGWIPRVRGLYCVDKKQNNHKTSPYANAALKTMSISEFHKKMGHINHDDLCNMVKKNLATGIDVDLNSKPEFCETCIKAKATRKPFLKRSTTEYKMYSEKVISDVWGPAAIELLGRKKYAVTYQDLYSWEEKAYYLQHKSETFNSYKKYEAWAKIQRNTTIKIFRSDRGGEFTSNEFSEHLENAGTVRHLTVHDFPASNGIAE
jgi:hypothetical protein